MDIGWIMLNPKSTTWLIYSHFCSEPRGAPASSSSLLWGKAFKLRGENLRGATSSDLAASQTGRSRWNHQKSSDITNHQTSMSNHLRTWKNPLATYATWGQLDNIGLRFFHFSFADTCRKRFDPSTSSTLPGHNEVPSWWYSATRSERHTGSPRPMRRWWTVGTWLHQLFCGKRMMSMTADDMYICIPSAYLT